MEQVRNHKVEMLPYPVLAGSGSFGEVEPILRPYHENGIFILTDENTNIHCLPVLFQEISWLANSSVFSVSPGENSKNISSLHHIWKWLTGEGAGRKSLLINLGGGVVSDLGGFAAATFNRGMDYVNIPTSLIGQADAAIGGKTGLNVDGIKNQAGLFYDPVAVVIYPGFLATLPESHLKSGWAEILKSAILAGGEFYGRIVKSSLHGSVNMPEMILHAVGFKCEVVAADPFDRNIRAMLNFGHTIGHALETLYIEKGREDFLHGMAVATGMICESWISFSTGRLSAAELGEIVDLIKRTFEPESIHKEDYMQLLAISTFDKKKDRGSVKMAVPAKIGGPMVEIPADQGLLFGSFDYLNSIIK